MAIQHSPEPTASRTVDFQTGREVIPNLAVLRGKRTRAKNALQTEIQELRQIDRLTDANRREFLILKARVEARIEAMRRVDEQICSHPQLPEGETDREIDDSEAATEVAHLARSLAEALLAADEQENRASPNRVGSTESPAHVSREPSTDSNRDVSDELNGAAIDGGGQQRNPQAHVDTSTSASATSSTDPLRTTCGANTFLSSGCSKSRYLDTTPETFDGTITRYKLWRSQFINYVRSRTEATGSDKLVALCKLLSGAPKQLISELPLTDNNFSVALKLLDDNYDVPELRQRDVLANIVNVPQVRSSTDTAGLRELLNVVQRTILALEAVQVSLPSIALPYEQTIRRALPTDLLFNFEQRHLHSSATTIVREPSDQATAATARLDQLLSFLRRYTALRERMFTGDSKQRNTVGESKACSSSRQQRNKIREPPKFPPEPQFVSTAAATVNANSRKPAKTRRNPCFFCQCADHLPSNCTADIPLHQRKEILAQRRRCATCFQFEHVPPKECAGPKVECQHCHSKTHYTVMHESKSAATPTPKPQSAASVAQTTPDTRAVVMTASAVVLYADKKVRVRCFIDSGSMISFVSPKLIGLLTGISPQNRAELRLQGFASEHAVTADRYALRLTSTRDDADPIIIRAFAYEFGVDPPANCSDAMRERIRRFGETHPLADAALTDQRYDIAPVLLIGVDQMYKILHLNSELEIGGGLIAKSSRLGWIVSGAFSCRSTRGDLVRIHTSCCATALTQPARDVERLWTLDRIDTSDSSKNEEFSVAELEALRQFREGVRYDGSAYTVSMPKRDSIALLANNLGVARKRLAAKRRSLARDPESFRRYDREIMEFLRLGHAEEVCAIDCATESARDQTFYMPHRQVVTQRPDGAKWRIVFDASAAAPGESSLNSHLLPGPNLNPDILKLLLNFRLRSVALSGDVAQAYMTINLAMDDRPYFRYLWQGPSDPQIRCFQMRKVTWGATPSGFLLAAVLREHFRRVDPDSKHDLGSSFYFDDMLCSFDTHAAATKFIDRLIPWMKSANMSLGKWKSNSAIVVNHLSRVLSSSASSGLVESGLLKVLGLMWAPENDEFQFQLSSLIDSAADLKSITKRNILRIVASIFDPVGWLIPFSLRGKLIIQQMWTTELRWDDPVLGPLCNDFLQWVREIPRLSTLRIPRMYGKPNAKVISYNLHIFGDASERAYAACAYLQSVYQDGGSESALVMSKSRLAPRDKITLPRLELMAAVLGARLRSFIVDRLGVRIDRVLHFTDSAVTFYWCTAEDPSKYKTFVCNRILEIQRLSSPDEWLHVEGKRNVCDVASRGCSADELISNSEWWSGPSWLTESEDRWPAKRLRSCSDRTDSTSAELRLVVTPAVVAPEMVDLDRFGTLEKAVRVVANVLRFVQRCRRLPLSQDGDLRSQAEKSIIRLTQARHFSPEISATRAGQPPTRSSKLNSFRLFLDEDGLLRARSRLCRDPHLSFDERNPIVIPGDSRFATLLILHHHRINAHLGVSTILCALRRRFWILRGRQVIKRLLHGCVICRRNHGPAADQVQAPLPAERTVLEAPFATAAVDFCGPFMTRTQDGTRKNYVALFTCCTVRAICLQVVPDMSAPQTHLALRRFLAEYPACRSIISDNGRSFVRVAADLKRLFNSFRDPEVRELLAQHRVVWNFQCPKAAFRGGLFERLVGVVKSALKKTLGRSLVGADEFSTIICELAAVINNRPLSYAYSDLDEPRAITPSEFLRGGPPAAPLCTQIPLDELGPNGRVQTSPPEAEQFRKALRDRTNYFRSLSTRWQREYLLLLRSANLDSKGKPRTLPDGAICLVQEDNVPRLKWSMVRILRNYPGRDGAVRTYGVRFANGHESRRPAQSLIPLEVPDRPREPESSA